MTLVTGWHNILRKAWSIRLILIAGLLTGAEAVISMVGANWLPGPQWARLLLIFCVMSGAFAARLLAQKGMSDAP